jgi:hypothetical protein
MPKAHDRPVTTLEGELAGLLRAARLTDRQARAVSARLGWDGGGSTTLQGAATPAGYTRERVRQLEAQVRRTLRGTQSQVPRVAEALRIVEASAPDSREHIAIRLAREGVAGAPFDPAGVITAGDVTGLTSSVYARHQLVLLHDQPPADNAAVILARSLTTRNGATNVDQLAREMRSTPVRVRRLLHLRSEVSWLDEHENWLHVSRAEPRLARRLRKMLSVSRSLTIAEANDGMRRSSRPMIVPPEILLSLCESIHWLLVDRDRQVVTTNVPLSQGRELAPIEQRLVAIFKGAGPVLTYRQATELGQREGLNRNSVATYLVRSPILTKLGRGRYALRGTVPSLAPLPAV